MSKKTPTSAGMRIEGKDKGDILYEARFHFKKYLVIKKQFKFNTYTQKCYISNFNIIETTEVLIFASRSVCFLWTSE